jgi:hypothetical protein
LPHRFLAIRYHLQFRMNFLDCDGFLDQENIGFVVLYYENVQ